MYVRKFEADSVDEAIKHIKYELGPDAVIIKTITNSGLKGSFKKKKIEITAAISEEDYQKKKKLDQLLSEDQKQNLYNKQSSEISKVIDQYHESKTGKSVAQSFQKEDSYASVKHSAHDFKSSAQQVTTGSNAASYGKIGINRPVLKPDINQETESPPLAPKDLSHQQQTLEEEMAVFMNSHPSKQRDPDVGERIHTGDDASISPLELDSDFEIKKFHQHSSGSSSSSSISKQKSSLHAKTSPLPNQPADHFGHPQLMQLEETVQRLQHQLEEMQLLQQDQQMFAHANEDHLLREMLRTLKTFDLSAQVMKFLLTELKKKNTENATEEDLWQVVLRSLQQKITVKKPDCFANPTPSVTVFLSEGTSGQTSLIFKCQSQVKRSSVLMLEDVKKTSKRDQVTARLIDSEIIVVSKISDLVSKAKELLAEGQQVFIDLKVTDDQQGQVKQLLATIRKSFHQHQVILCLNALFDDLYLKKILQLWHREVDLMAFTHLDMCLTWAKIINFSIQFQDLPLTVMSRGPVIPVDLFEAQSGDLLKHLFGLQ